MVGEQLGELGRALAARLLDPRRQLGMSAAALPARQAGIGHVADEDVLEDELALPGERRRRAIEHELAAAERPQHRVEVVRTREPRHRAVPEDAADDSRALRDPLLLWRQQVEPGEDHRLHVVRDLDVLDRRDRTPTAVLVHEQPLVDQVTDDLLEEERVPLGPLEDPLAHGRRQPVDVQQGRDETCALLARQRVERQRAEAATTTAPVRPRAQEVGTRRAQEQDRPLDALGELVEEVEHRRVRPVDVLDDHDDRRSAGDRRQQLEPGGDELSIGLTRLDHSERVVRRPQADAQRERGDGPAAHRLGAELTLDELLELRERGFGRVGVEDAAPPP